MQTATVFEPFHLLEIVILAPPSHPSVPCQEPQSGLDWGHADLQSLVGVVRKAVAKGMFTPDPLIPIVAAPCCSTFSKLRESL